MPHSLPGFSFGSLMLLGMLPMGLPAGLLTFDFTSEINGDPLDLAGTGVSLSATFDDLADAVGENGVRLSIDLTGPSDSEAHLKAIHFNFSGDVDALEMAAYVAVPAGLKKPGKIAYEQPSVLSGGGNHHFSFGFDFKQAGKFGVGERLVVDLEYTQPITVSSFLTVDLHGSSRGNGRKSSPSTVWEAGDHYAGAHVGGLGPEGRSDKLAGVPRLTTTPVPEPGSLIGLLTILSVGSLLWRRRR